MTTTEKNEIIDNIMSLLIRLTEQDSTPQTAPTKPVEMLTIKECTEVIQGLSEHTVRQLVAQGNSGLHDCCLRWQSSWENSLICLQ